MYVRHTGINTKIIKNTLDDSSRAYDIIYKYQLQLWKMPKILTFTTVYELWRKFSWNGHKGPF